MFDTFNRISALLTIIVVAMLVSTGCKRRVNDYESFHNIDGGWHYGDRLDYDIVEGDSVREGALVLSVRHTNMYLYSNLWLEISIRDSLSERTDTIEVKMADRLGNWLGRGVGTDFEIVDTLDSDLVLHRPVTMSIRHIMRDERLDDIERVGLTYTARDN